ncbi:MAG: spore coat protein YsxE [Bacillus sp. (in: firmicutes)]
MGRSENHSVDVQEIMDHYRLRVQYSESFGRLRKIYTDQGIFALKAIAPEHSMDFIKHVQQLYQRGYNRLVPIFMTHDGRFGVLSKQTLYYLMPWFSNDETGERNEKHKQMFRELARVHSLTAKKMEVNKEEREVHYEKTKDAWERQKEFLDEFVERCEKKWYMSPFELLFCSYYYDVFQAVTFSLRKFEEWYEETKEQEEIRTVVTHGKLSVKHFLFDERGYGYFINLENARIVPQHFDLLPFFVKYCFTYPTRCDECVEWFYHYNKFFPMREEEMTLFTSYLAYPANLLDLLETYNNKKYEMKTEYQYVNLLQRQYWQLKNVEYFVMKIEEIEGQKKAAKKATENQANN